MQQKPKIVLLGLPTGSGHIPVAMVASLLQLQKPLPCAFSYVERQRTDKARNGLVLEALKNGADYLLMIDDDNPVPSDTLKLMLEDDKDIVIAPILSRNSKQDGTHDLCAFYAKKVKVDGKPLRLYSPIKDFKDKGPLHKIDAGGTGCMLIKRAVLEKLYALHQGQPFEFGDIRFKKKIKVDGIEYDRRTMSEDVEFCERAVDAGFEVWLDDRIRPIHFGRMTGVQWKPE
jgi:GT2 family glycosyltransferase